MEETTLGDIVTSHWGGYSFRSDDYTNAGTPVLTKGDVKPRGVIEHGGRFISEDKLADKRIKLTTARDFLITTRDLTTAADFLGLVARAPTKERFAVNQGVTVFQIDERKVDPRYLSYWCEGALFRGHIKGHYAGATQIHIRHADVMSAPVRLPPLDMQHRIASVLSAYDDLIENNTRRIVILEKMARRIYEEWFVRFRFPGHENMRMVESELGLMPEGWAVRELAEVTIYINRGLAPKYDAAAPMQVINQKCIRDQRLNLSEARTQCKPIPVDKQVQIGDVLINSTGIGTLGRVAQVLEGLEQCTVDTHVSIVRPNNDVDIHFFGLSLFLKQCHFEAAGVGSTGQTELSRSRIAETKIVVPKSELQREFAKAVRPMRELALNLHKKNSNLQATRDLLLPKLISGELDVSTVPEPEAAIA